MGNKKMVCQSHYRPYKMAEKHKTKSVAWLCTSQESAWDLRSRNSQSSLGVTVFPLLNPYDLQYFHLLNWNIFTHFTAWQWALQEIIGVKNIWKLK